MTQNDVYSHRFVSMYCIKILYIHFEINNKTKFFFLQTFQVFQNFLFLLKFRNFISFFYYVFIIYNYFFPTNQNKKLKLQYEE